MSERLHCTDSKFIVRVLAHALEEHEHVFVVLGGDRRRQSFENVEGDAQATLVIHGVRQIDRLLNKSYSLLKGVASVSCDYFAQAGVPDLVLLLLVEVPQVVDQFLGEGNHCLRVN